MIKKFISPGLFLYALIYMQACKKPFEPSPETAGSAHSMRVAFSALSASNLQVFTLAGDGSTAILNSPTGVAVDSHGNAYVADAANNRIRKITPDGIISTLAGSGAASLVNGNGTAATFNHPTGVAVDKNDNIYIADSLNHAIRKITQGGDVTTYAGTGQPGYTEGPASTAQFNGPAGVAVDTAGNVYVADAGNERIRKVTTNMLVALLAGDGNAGYSDLPGRFAEFDTPTGIAVDNNNLVYVADKGNNVIRSITQAGAVNTFAGISGELNAPSGIVIDTGGTAYVADRGSHTIKIITAAGVVSTLAGNGIPAFMDGIPTVASFKFPTGVAVDGSGGIYVADYGNNRIRKIGFVSVLNAVAAGAIHSAIIKSDNSLWITGDNYFGELGDGTNTKKNIPVKIMDNVKSVVIGCTSSHTLIIKTDNSLWGTGANTYGALGDGTYTNKKIPIKMMDNVRSVAGGQGFSLIVKTDNSLWATGDNVSGQLGDGTTTGKTIPAKMMDNVKTVAAGAFHTLIVKTDNSLWVTGDNMYGQLGDGTTNRKLTPIKLMDNVQAVAAGVENSFILKTDNSLWATGANGWGQLGDGTSNNERYSPVKIMDSVKAIAAGARHTLFLKTDNTLWAAGAGDAGQFGNGNYFGSVTLLKIADNVKAMAAGGYFTLVIKTNDNTPLSTGNNSTGQLGNGNYQNTLSFVPMLLP